MSNVKPLFTKDGFKSQPVEFRIAAIFSDGMWYTKEKIKKYTKASFEEIDEWVEKALEDGIIVGSPSGEASYRMPYDSLVDWHKSNGIEIGSQIIRDIFPARVWDGMTETEGFISAPIREMGAVSFHASPKALNLIKERLEGVAKVRSQEEPGKYKAFCLSASYASAIIEEALDEMGEGKSNGYRKTYARQVTKRRDMVDFSPAFAHGLVEFYSKFSKTLVRKEMETIKIFLPEPEDQDSQIMTWVLDAIEKFHQDAPVPFSAYLSKVLSNRPYDLPSIHLGKDLAEFQRLKSKKIKEMRKANNYPEDHVFDNKEIAEAMGYDMERFKSLDEQNKMWLETRKASSLTWNESPEEKMIESSIYGEVKSSSAPSDIALASKISRSIIRAALSTSKYDDALNMASQVGVSEIDMSSIKSISPEFISTMGRYMGVED